MPAKTEVCPLASWLARQVRIKRTYTHAHTHIQTFASNTRQEIASHRGHPSMFHLVAEGVKPNSDAVELRLQEPLPALAHAAGSGLLLRKGARGEDERAKAQRVATCARGEGKPLGIWRRHLVGSHRIFSLIRKGRAQLLVDVRSCQCGENRLDT